nr:hypothetical protein [Tanacetum cinerariifolium]
MRIEFNKPQRETTYQVTFDVLKLSPFYLTFLITAEAPKIYMHQFWNTIKKIKDTPDALKRSKQDTNIHQKGGSSKGADSESKVLDEPKEKETQDDEYVHTPEDYVPTNEMNDESKSARLLITLQHSFQPSNLMSQIQSKSTLEQVGMMVSMSHSTKVLNKELYIIHEGVADKIKKRKQDDADKDKGPSAGSDQGLKRRKTSKDTEPSKKAKSIETSKGTSKGTSKSQPKSTNKFAQAEETVFEAGDTQEPHNQGQDMGNIDDQPNVKAAPKYDWFKKPERPPNPDSDWNNNPEGKEYPFDLSKPLPLVMEQGRQVVPVDYFINNDLEYLGGGNSCKKYMTSTTKTKATKKLDWRCSIKFRGGLLGIKCSKAFLLLVMGYVVDFDPKKDEKDPKEDPAYYPPDRGKDDDDESSNDDDDVDDVEKDEEDKKEEEHLAPADPSDVSTDDLETMTTVSHGMSVEEIKRVVAQRVANTIEAIAIYETKTILAHKSMNQTERQEEEVAENASNKRKWESNHNGSLSQQNKGHKLNKRQNTGRAYTARHGEKKHYNGAKPLCSKCNYHHVGPCAPKCHQCNRFGHLACDCRSSTNANASNIQKGTGASQKATCYECGNKGHYKRDCPEQKNQNHENQIKSTKARGVVHAIGGGETEQDFNNIEDEIEA